MQGLSSAFFIENFKEGVKMGIRYNKITDKHQREIVLLKSFPCKYGKCSFCNYIEDNSLDEKEIDAVNMEVLKENNWRIWSFRSNKFWICF